MGIRKYKPTTPGRRGSSVADFVEVTRSTPEKSLIRPLPTKGGRNDQTEAPPVRPGDVHQRAYRVIDLVATTRRRAGQGRASRSTTRTARRASRSCTTRTGLCYCRLLFVQHLVATVLVFFFLCTSLVQRIARWHFPALREGAAHYDGPGGSRCPTPSRRPSSRP